VYFIVSLMIVIDYSAFIMRLWLTNKTCTCISLITRAVNGSTRGYDPLFLVTFSHHFAVFSPII